MELLGPTELYEKSNEYDLSPDFDDQSKHIRNIHFENGNYDLGLAPTKDNEGKLLFRLKIKNGIIEDLDNFGGLDWSSNIKFILGSGECSLNQTKNGCKYLLLSSDDI